MAASPDVKSVFGKALELETPADRATYLDQACGGDAALRGEVEGLLAALGKAGRFMSHPAVAPPDVAAPRPDEAVGTAIGPYKLLQKLGEGGMGAVYLAEQDQPVKRRVAIKLIKAGLSSPQAVARFKHERQTLALMDHPNIAQVWDAGTTGASPPTRSISNGAEDTGGLGFPEGEIEADGGELGRSYVVMELVKGVPITQYCDQERLTPRERLELFVPVCQAVQHAHQKGIIHRDLKPSNVLIAQYDGRPVPKVIDFGVAKAVDPTLSERTRLTEVGVLVGTLEYMAPEQAELNNLDIDTRADIYSLGVILYELLTGSPPFTSRQLRDARLAEMLRLVKEVEPQRPSTRLTSSDELSRIAASRRVEPRALTRQIAGELDWIVMKCLEKDRTRRYETANELALEIQRYLADEPVIAGPPSATYRLKKFLRRNQGAVMAASVVVLALLGGIVGTTVGLVRAQEARQAEAERAEGERVARLAAEKAEKAARESEADTNAFGDFLVVDVLWAARPAGDRGGLGVNVTMREALETAQGTIGTRFRDRPRAEATARHALGVTFRLIGELHQAEPHLRRALSLRKEALGDDHEDTLQSQNSLGVLLNELGRYEEATPLLEQTLKLRQAKLGADHPHTLSSMVNLGWSYREGARLDLALPLFKEALELRTAKLGLEDPDTLNSMDHLARAYRDARKLDLALPLAENSLKLHRTTQGPDHTDTLAGMYVVASCYAFAGKFDIALPLAEETVKLQTAILGPDHPHTLSSMVIVAAGYRAKRKLDVALPLYKQVFEGRKAKLGADHHLTLIAMALLAQAHLEAGKVELALPLAQKAVERSTATGPDRSDTIYSMAILASCYRAAKDPGPALPLYEAVFKFRMKQPGPDDPATRQTMVDLAHAYWDAGKVEQAVPLLQQAVAALEKREFTDHGAATVLWTLIEAHQRLRQFDQAEVGQRKMVALAKKQGPDGWHNSELAKLGSCLLAQKKFVDAESVLRDCLAFRDKVWPDGWLRFNGQSLLGAALAGQEKYTEAEPLLLQGYEGMKKREAQIPADHRIRLRQALERLIQLYDAWEKPEQADSWRKKLDLETK
jgi:serine/threonine protein kinase/Tfp pilus assembly protein PilF